MFVPLQPLFDAEQPAFETDHIDAEEWEKLYEPITALNLYLLGDDGKKLKKCCCTLLMDKPGFATYRALQYCTNALF